MLELYGKTGVYRVQLDLRRSKVIGWFHDGIFTIDINGIEVYVGILEVAGNAVVTDHTKFLGDQKKMLKGNAFGFS
ncbi:6568_t:CDS:2 [Funneliformis geosporum]|uniref:6565_t:CDS:1 n=1 Tax=Funneliformis geosporum TaxID=1117311 RepID=A0A9W4T1S0_9GLOM|nr:6568_t:CDS:2 [Funneliformis geosporum]CAI2188613.1 6565_t:CDS:2 [Funneliformis geosporum]